MDNIIVNVNTLPEFIHRRIRGDRVRVREENGAIILMPVQDLQQDTWEALEQLRDMLSDGKMSTEKYVAQKQVDKELER